MRELNKEGTPLDMISADIDMYPLLPSCPCLNFPCTSAEVKLLDLPIIRIPGRAASALMFIDETAG